jgi:uncharacterized repeat protein (TIGR01451 family)
MLVCLAWFGAAPAAAEPAITPVPVLDALAEPTQVTYSPDGTRRLFVVEKGGTIQVVVDGLVQSVPFLDISTLVNSRGAEQGLLGLAFHPAYATNRWFFVAYTALDGASTVARYRASDDPNVADRSSGTVVLSIPHAEFTNHNGGDLVFGPDGFLYIGTGDGGGGGDPRGNGQNLMALLGKMLRIDVDGAQPYGIPPSNPFVGVADARPEIWAYGLRNPWRYSFDRLTGDLYIGDVGQNLWEEVDFQPGADPGGQNYGWSIMEGFHCYPPGTVCDQTGLTLPIDEYGHELGCAIIGGHVYRGLSIPSLVGAYVFGDECSARIWSLRLDVSGTWFRTELARLQGSIISSFGEDQDGEIYVVDLNGAVFRLAEDLPPPLHLGVKSTTARSAAELSYVLTVANDGPAEVSEVILTDRLPSGAELVEARASRGTCRSVGRDLSCRLGSLGGGADISVDVRLRIASGAALDSHTVRVSGLSAGQRRVAQSLSAPFERRPSPQR